MQPVQSYPPQYSTAAAGQPNAMYPGQPGAGGYPTGSQAGTMMYQQQQQQMQQQQSLQQQLPGTNPSFSPLVLPSPVFQGSQSGQRPPYNTNAYGQMPGYPGQASGVGRQLNFSAASPSPSWSGNPNANPNYVGGMQNPGSMGYGQPGGAMQQGMQNGGFSMTGGAPAPVPQPALGGGMSIGGAASAAFGNPWASSSSVGGAVAGGGGNAGGVGGGSGLNMQQLARNEDPVLTHAMFSDLIDLNSAKPRLGGGKGK